MNSSARNISCFIIGIIALSGMANTNSSRDFFRDTIKTDDELKSFLKREFTSIDGSERASGKWVLENLDVSSEQLRRVLNSIYQESKKILVEDKEKNSVETLRLENAVRQMAYCANDETTFFLINLATDSAQSNCMRGIAVESYLRASSSDIAEKALYDFLLGKYRDISFSIYNFLPMLLEEFSSEKRIALLRALYKIAMQESGKIAFLRMDQILCKWSKAYQHSKERLDKLSLHSKEPPTTNLYTDRDLKAALDEARSYTGYTILGTNLAAWALLDSPQADQLVPNLALDQKDVERTNAKCRWHIIGIGLVAGLAAAAGVWFYRKKRAV